MSSDDIIISFIRLLRTLGLTKLSKAQAVGAVFTLLLLSGGVVFLLTAGGGGTAPTTTGVDTVDVTVTEPSNGTVTFQLHTLGTADTVILTPDDGDRLNLTTAGQTHTLAANQTVIVTGMWDGTEQYITTYEPAVPTPNESADGDGAENDEDASEDEADAQGAETTGDVVNGVQASFTVQTATVDAGEPVQFDASGSTLPEDASDVQYEWEFGDGETATGAVVSHTYMRDGTYDVSLTVTVTSDAISRASGSVTVENARPTAVATASQKQGTAKTEFLFSGSDSTDPDGDDLTYEWEFGDASSATGRSVQHTFATAGSYRVTLSVSDPYGGVATDSFDVHIDNSPPRAIGEFDRTAAIASTVQFSGSNSTDPDAQELTYEWEFGNGNTSTGMSAETRYDSAGTYTVRLYVTDSKGVSDVYKGLITIGESDGEGGINTNVQPRADASGPTEGPVGTYLDFYGTESFDSDGDQLTYEWDFGDGTTGAGSSPGHRYDESGTYTVTLFVSDGQETDTDTLSVTIVNTPPVASVTSNTTTPRAHDLVLFNASGSSDANGHDLTYEWDFDDDGMVDMTGESVTYAYSTGGTYTARVTATDEEGATDNATLVVDVQNTPPTALVTSNTTVVGPNGTVQFDASASNDRDGDAITSYEWTFADGAVGTGEQVQHTYTTTGQYNATVTVTDALGATANDSVQITVQNRPPVATATANTTSVGQGEAVLFDASNSTDPDGDVLSYAWEFSDGTFATGATVERSFDEPGTVNATVEVMDGNGGSDYAALSVTVSNTPPTASIEANRTTTEPTETIAFDGSASADVDGDTLSYEWDFDDGVVVEGQMAQHAYAEAGTYTVTLTVSDGTASTTATETIQIPTGTSTP